MLIHQPECKWMLALVLILAEIPLFGQSQNLSMDELRTRIEQRYTVLPIQNGIVLSPKNRDGIASVEISGNTVAVNGAEVTGAELRTRLGDDTELILQLSYLMPSERQRLFTVAGSSNSSQVSPRPGRREVRPRRGRRKDDVIRFLGNVTVSRDEILNGDVVVFGGNARSTAKSAAIQSCWEAISSSVLSPILREMPSWSAVRSRGTPAPRLEATFRKCASAPAPDSAKF